MIPAQAKLQIIGGKGGSGVHLGGIRTITRTEGEDAESAADLGLAEGGGFGFAEAAKFASAALDDGARDFVGESGGFGAGAFRKRENVKIGEGQALNEGERGGVVFFGFARE